MLQAQICRMQVLLSGFSPVFGVEPLHAELKSLKLFPPGPTLEHAAS